MLVLGEELFQLLEFHTKSCCGTGININVIMVVIQYGWLVIVIGPAMVVSVCCVVHVRL